MSVSAVKVLVKSDNGNGMLKQRRSNSPALLVTALPQRQQEEHNGICLPAERLFTLKAGLLCNSTLLLAKHFSAETVSVNSINPHGVKAV